MLGSTTLSIFAFQSMIDGAEKVYEDLRDVSMMDMDRLNINDVMYLEVECKY